MTIFPRPRASSLVQRRNESLSLTPEPESDPELFPGESSDEFPNDTSDSDSDYGPESERDSVMGEPTIQEGEDDDDEEELYCDCPICILESNFIMDVLDLDGLELEGPDHVPAPYTDSTDSEADEPESVSPVGQPASFGSNE